jgi:glycogen debranching enzyme
LTQFLSTAERCVEWAEHYGDKDGDGFIEYAPLSPAGYRNQGWKDSSDAIVYPDGRLVDPPIAICEVQGYYYDALVKMAALYDLLGQPARARELASRAERLYRLIQERLWWEEEGFYYLGLDADKRPIKTVASNAGHLLWSRAVPADRAGRVAFRLFRDDLYSGWGIRTLSADHRMYNPISYQRGSVWPHENAIIAQGLKGYGFDREAQRLAEGIFTASTHFESERLPELFGGVERSAHNFPVLYREANVPQAWSAASIFYLLEALLGIEPALEKDEVTLSPALPEWLSEATLRRLTIRGADLSIRFFREGETTRWEVLESTGPLEITGLPLAEKK